jgi:DtxR family Mn-dependent transcriptional regulator
MLTSNQAPESLTRSVEDYLKAIYRLSDQGQHATTSEIAHHLGLSAPSVTGMVKRLSEQGLVTHEPYKGVSLTPEGRRGALRVLRRHRLIEAYLVGFLGYGWETVHAEAERLEHAVSDVLIERMAAALGHPEVDPHGDPIPSADGSINDPRYFPLTQLAPGETAEIRQVATNEPERLRYLGTLGLLPGTTITIERREPFEGPISVRTGARQQVLGHEIAQVLLCARTGERP